MHKDRPSLARFATLNPKGRLLCLAAPVLAAASAHVIVLALGGPAEVGAVVGCLAATAASIVAAWLWLDEPMAFALEPACARGAFIVSGLAFLACILSPQLAFAMGAYVLVSFGGLAGLSRITAFSDAPEQPAGSGALGWLAWAAQAAMTIAVLSTTSVPCAAAVTATVASAGAAMLLIGKRPELPAVGELD